MSVATDKSENGGGLGETVKIIIQALLIALVIRTVAYQPFNIPSGSMKSTLLIGDYLFVSKFSYGFSRFSLPFSPDLFEGRLFGQPPKRGDVAVFKLPSDDSTDFIKRVIGLPGDRIQMIDGILHINGTAVERERVEDFVENGRQVARYRETLPNGVSYMTLDLTPNGLEDNTQVFEVPPEHYFMMGDNRDNSTDSRVSPTRGGVGYVPFENFVGRAEIIFFSVDEKESVLAVWNWPWSVRTDRLFKLL